MSKSHKAYLPAAGHDWFLPLYDPLVKLMGGDQARKALIDQAGPEPGQRLLEIGCGTGTVVIMIKQLHPDVEVVGLDPDVKALARARRKAERASVSAQFARGFSDKLPYADASFDRVFSSFMFHHLEPEQKERTLREVRRVLRPGGTLHLLDFGGPPSSSPGFLGRLVHSAHRLKDNYSGGIPRLMGQAGFQDPREVSHGSMLFMRTAYYRATAPADGT